MRFIYIINNGYEVEYSHVTQPATVYNKKLVNSWISHEDLFHDNKSEPTQNCLSQVIINDQSSVSLGGQLGMQEQVLVVSFVYIWEEFYHSMETLIHGKSAF